MVELKTNVFNYSFENRFKTTFMHPLPEVRALAATNSAINLPTVILGQTEQPTNIRKIWIPGDSLEYEDINLQFMLQEDMSNWLAIMNWLYRLRDPDVVQYEREVCEIGVDILNAKHESVAQVTFIDCFPFTLSDVPLTTQVEDTEISRFDVSFKINGMDYNSVTQ